MISCHGTLVVVGHRYPADERDLPDPWSGDLSSRCRVLRSAVVRCEILAAKGREDRWYKNCALASADHEDADAIEWGKNIWENPEEVDKLPKPERKRDWARMARTMAARMKVVPCEDVLAVSRS